MLKLRHHFFEFLKEIDNFKQPIQLQMSRKRNKSCFGERYNPDIGTIYGGMISIFALFCCISYFGILINQMYTGNRDIINMLMNSVTAEDQRKGIALNDFTFFPLLELSLLNLSDEKIKMLQHKGIIFGEREGQKTKFNFTALEEYIKLSIRV